MYEDNPYQAMRSCTSTAIFCKLLGAGISIPGYILGNDAMLFGGMAIYATGDIVGDFAKNGLIDLLNDNNDDSDDESGLKVMPGC